jgi:hypothetical protein
MKAVGNFIYIWVLCKYIIFYFGQLIFFYQFICSSREMKIMEITYSVQKEVNNCFYLTMQEQFPNWNHAAYSLIDGPNVNSFPSCLKLATVLKEAF